MIIDGSLPDPEAAHAQLRERLERDQRNEPGEPLGEPWDLLPDPVPIRRA
jgi:hypothetical protein